MVVVIWTSWAQILMSCFLVSTSAFCNLNFYVFLCRNCSFKENSSFWLPNQIGTLIFSTHGSERCARVSSCTSSPDFAASTCQRLCLRLFSHWCFSGFTSKLCVCCLDLTVSNTSCLVSSLLNLSPKHSTSMRWTFVFARQEHQALVTCTSGGRGWRSCTI